MYRFIHKSYFKAHDWFEDQFFYYTAKLFKKPHPKNFFDFRTRDFLKHLESSDRVADLGCGTGKLILEMQDRVEYCLAVDLKKPLLLNENSGVEFVQMNVTSPELPSLLNEKKINTVTISHILEHIEGSVSFLKGLASIPKILICVPSQENWRYQYKRELGLDARLDPTHFREYTIPMLVDEVTKAGLETKEVFYNSEGELFAFCSGKHQ